MSYGSHRGAHQKPAKPSAVSWALRQQCDSPAQKLVLVAMADLSSGMREGYAGPGYLAERTGVPETEVRCAIDALRGVGLLAWTGRSKGPKGRGPIWVLAVDGPVSEPAELSF